MFPGIQLECPLFQFMLIATGPVTGHHLKEPGSTFVSHSLQVFMGIDKVFPWTFCSPGLTGPTTSDLYVRCFSHSIIFVDYHKYVCISLLLRQLRIGHNMPAVASSVLNREAGSLLLTCRQHSFYSLKQQTVYCNSTLLAPVQLSVQQDPQVLLSSCGKAVG